MRRLLFVTLLLTVGFILAMPDVVAAQDGPTVTTRRGNEVPLPLACAVVVVAGASAYWVYEDAKSRGGPACLWALVVYFVAWPISLLAYFFFRPEEPSHSPHEYYQHKKPRDQF